MIIPYPTKWFHVFNWFQDFLWSNGFINNAIWLRFRINGAKW